MVKIIYFVNCVEYLSLPIILFQFVDFNYKIINLLLVKLINSLIGDWEWYHVVTEVVRFSIFLGTLLIQLKLIDSI